MLRLSGKTARDSVSDKCTWLSTKPGQMPEHPAVDDLVELRPLMPSGHLAGGTDIEDPVVLDHETGVAQHRIAGIDEKGELEMLDQGAHGMVAPECGGGRRCAGTSAAALACRVLQPLTTSSRSVLP